MRPLLLLLAAFTMMVMAAGASGGDFILIESAIYDMELRPLQTYHQDEDIVLRLRLRVADEDAWRTELRSLYLAVYQGCVQSGRKLVGAPVVISRSSGDVWLPISLTGEEPLQVWAGQDAQQLTHLGVVKVSAAPPTTRSTGVELPMVRVLLMTTDLRHSEHRQAELVSLDGELQVIAADGQTVVAGSSLTFKAHQGNVVVNTASGSHNLEGKVSVVSTSGRIQIQSLRRGYGAQAFHPVYRGAIELSATPSGRLRLINEVGLEDYVLGVLPSEMPVSWPSEALKAQAIVSRTYVARSLLAKGALPDAYHVDDTMFSQVYNHQPESPAARLAVEATEGLVVWSLHEDTVARVFYHSTAAGVTACAASVWNDAARGFPAEPIPYLVSRPLTDPPVDVKLATESEVAEFIKNPQGLLAGAEVYEMDSPWYRWHVYLSGAEAESIINANLAARYRAEPRFVLTKTDEGFRSQPISDQGVGRLQDVQVVQRGMGGNAMALDIVGSHGTYRVLKELNIRRVLPPDSRFTGGPGITIYQRHQTVQDHPILPSSWIVLETTYGQDGLEGVTVYGAGHGHGVGMSQWAARGMALSGLSYPQILRSFFTDVELMHLQKM